MPRDAAVPLSEAYIGSTLLAATTTATKTTHAPVRARVRATAAHRPHRGRGRGRGCGCGWGWGCGWGCGGGGRRLWDQVGGAAGAELEAIAAARAARPG